MNFFNKLLEGYDLMENEMEFRSLLMERRDKSDADKIIKGAPGLDRYKGKPMDYIIAFINGRELIIKSYIEMILDAPSKNKMLYYLKDALSNTTTIKEEELRNMTRLSRNYHKLENLIKIVFNDEKLGTLFLQKLGEHKANWVNEQTYSIQDIINNFIKKFKPSYTIETIQSMIRNNHPGSIRAIQVFRNKNSREDIQKYFVPVAIKSNNTSVIKRLKRWSYEL